jgi:starvation-inducible DNA-binding protein
MTNKATIEALKSALADTYALYLKTQNYHWNVEGSHFKPLHQLFEEQYKDLAEAVDTLAELIRGLGEKAPATFGAYAQITSIKDGDEDASAEQMIKDLLDDQATIQQTLQQTLETAQQASDEVVVNFMTERLTVHRKAAWMLRSMLID